ncbi:MAG: tetratricopeptide repeat protein [Phycisphaerales bacterium]|nr:MAG: tetratricopeptide repeat protein [Phycisphaerales bacterium]
MGKPKKDGKLAREPVKATCRDDHARRHELWLLPIVVIIVGTVAYLSSFSGTFVFDDNPHIIENSRIRSLWPPWRILDSRRPMVCLSLAVNYAMGGLEDLWSYHAFNLTIHILTALTLLGIIRRTLMSGAWARLPAHSAPWIALAAALIWVVHPLQTQCVTYIIQRGESMMGLFYLLTLYCVIRGVDSPHRRLWYAAAIVACALGMGSKAVMVTAPLVVLLYDWVFISKSMGQVLRLRWGLYLGLAATWSVLFASGLIKGVFSPPSYASVTVGLGFKGISPLEYLATQPGVVLHYLRLAIWPHPLCLDYGWPVARTAWALIPPALIMGVLLAGTAWALLRKLWWGFLGTWFFLILAPTSSVMPIRDPIYEHRMYLSLAAIVILAVIAGHMLLGRLVHRVSIRRFLAAGLTLAIVVVLSYGTYRRNRVYESPLAMWSDVVAKRPGNVRAHYNLGRNLAQQGRLDEAVEAYRETVRLEPTHYFAYNNLGTSLAKQDKFDEAIKAFRRSRQISPSFAEAHFNLGNCLLRQRKLDEAVDAFREALRYDPGFASAHYNLGVALQNQGRLDEAIEEYRETLRLEQDHAGAERELRQALTRKKAGG